MQMHHCDNLDPVISEAVDDSKGKPWDAALAPRLADLAREPSTGNPGRLPYSNVQHIRDDVHTRIVKLQFNIVTGCSYQYNHVENTAI